MDLIKFDCNGDLYILDELFSTTTYSSDELRFYLLPVWQDFLSEHFPS